MASNYAFITENDRISATYGPGLFYEFDFGLACTQVYWGHELRELAWRDGQGREADQRPRRRLFAKFQEGVRYWNGSAWTAEPSMNRR